MSFIPYETLSRVEAEDIGRNLPSSLESLIDQQKSDLEELLAGAYARGLDAAFAMSEFAGQDPATAMEIYSAGYAKGKLEESGGNKMSNYLEQDEVALRLTSAVTTDFFTTREAGPITALEARRLALDTAKFIIDFVAAHPPDNGLMIDGVLINLEEDK